jgi:hypothetical protein
MGQWRSLSEIIEGFSLPAESSNATARAELLRRLAKIHPDKTSGEFTSEEDEGRYHEIQNAVRAIDELKTRASDMVRYTEQPISIQRDVQTEIRAEENTLRSQVAKSTRSRFRGQKIRSAVVGGAIAGMMAFSTKLVEHPMVSNLLSYMDTESPLLRPIADATFLAAILAACGFFYGAWKREHREKAQSDRLLTDRGISDLFNADYLKSRISDQGQFSAIDLAAAIQSRGEYVFYWFPKLLPRNMYEKLPSKLKLRRVNNTFSDDLVLAQQAADLILNKLELRGAVSAGASGTLTRVYRLSDAAREQLGEPVRQQPDDIEF